MVGSYSEAYTHTEFIQYGASQLPPLLRTHPLPLQIKFDGIIQVRFDCLGNVTIKNSLGSRPSPYVRVLIARGWENRSSGIREGMIRHVRRRSSRTVPRARPVVQAWHVIYLISGCFDSLFPADSGGEEQDDWLLG